MGIVKLAVVLFIASVVLLDGTSTADDAVAKANDPLALKLEKARKTYDETVTKVRSAINKDLDKAEKKARQTGKFDVVSKIKEEKADLDAEGMFPTVIPTKEYQNRVDRAFVILVGSLGDARRRYLKAGKDELADNIDKELKSRQALKEKLVIKDILNGVRAPSVPDDAIEFNGKYYKLFEQVMTWHKARDKCEEMGGRLAIVRNEAENKFLTSLLQPTKSGWLWLGATDEVVEGRWMWVDGSAVTFTSWDPDGGNQPNGQRTENYMILHKGEKWWDFVKDPGSFAPIFVCQWDPNARTIKPKSAADAHK